MMARHLEALAAPWLERRRRRGGPWIPLALLLASQLPFAIVVWRHPEVRLQTLSFSFSFALMALWLMHFNSLRRQNHPIAARLVPGHLRVLREVLVGLWLALAAVIAVLPGSGLGWALIAAALMAALALFALFPLLWALMSVIPLGLSLLARAHAFDALRAWWTQGQARPALFIGAMLVLGWLLSRLLQDGDAAHVRRYAAAAKRPGTRRLSGRRLGTLLALISQGPLRAWRRHVIASAAPTPASRLARLELALGSHWVAQLIGVLVFVGLLGVSAAVAWWGFHFPLLGIRGDNAIGLMIGAISATLAPMLGLRASLYKTRREQALLMLLPGLPRGAALNRALAARQWRRLLPGWAVAMAVVIAFSRGTPVFWSCVAFGLACLPWALLALSSDWARLPAVSGDGAQSLPVLLMLGSGLAAMAFQRLVQPSPLWLLGLLLLTLALGLQRWRALSRSPQALPVARLGGQ